MVDGEDEEKRLMVSFLKLNLSSLLYGVGWVMSVVTLVNGCFLLS